MLVLTFSRKAAEELRERITVRLGRTISEPSAYTFHGFCHAVVRSYAALPGGEPPRLLSGAERELRVRDLLRGNAAGEGRTHWPAEFRPALALRGFARELADLLDRARERGLDGPGLTRLGVEHGRPAWVAAGQFLDEYLGVLDIRGELDYAGLVATATQLLSGPAAALPARYRAVFVDEYQDTDPAQEQLLQRPGRRRPLLVVVGDPDQSIYAFRGAEVENVLKFRDRFAQANGDLARVTSLRVCRRFGRELLDVSRAAAQRIPLGSLTSQRAEHRGLEAAGPAAWAGPEIRLFASVADEVAAIGDLLRRAHLKEHVPWREMAVLVRSGVRSIPVLRRALVAAGVPVSVAADELPLARDPSVAPLIAALQVAAHGDAALTPDAARLLLLSPLGRASPAVVRALGRRLRALDREAGAALPRPSAILIRDAIADPRDLLMIEDWVADPARLVADRFAEARRLAVSGASPEEVLWSLYDGSGWGKRLARDSLAGGVAGRAADRDLDAMLGLFDAAARLEDRKPRAGVTALLDEVVAQEIPASPYEERGTTTDAVRLLTAHRAKGLEWDVVVVSGVQEGVWPDVRRRGTLLEADAVSAGGLREAPTTASLLVEERRLFYVALTRARRQLVITAVSAVDDEGERPSRFLEELELPIPDTILSGDRVAVAGFARRADAPRTCRPAQRQPVACFRSPATCKPCRRGRCRRRASRCCRRPRNVVGRARRRRVSRPSALATYQSGCPGRRCRASTLAPAMVSSIASACTGAGASSAQGFGTAVHALAEAVGTGELAPEPAALLERLDGIWAALPFDAPWQSQRERREAEAVITRFLAWHAANNRRLVGTEVPFEVPHGDDVVLRGRADRVEVDDDDGVHIVDLKTSKYPPKGKDLDREPQLGIYQLAVRAGAFREQTAGPPGGAELVQLRKSAYGKVKVQRQTALAPTDSWADELVAEVARGIRGEVFPARPNDLCDRCPYRTSCPAHDAGHQVVE